jgi:primosomal protein N' (replication factor Y)
MTKSSLPYVDVLFPLSIGPLTYACPEKLAAAAVPGMLVSAPIKNKSTPGILLRKHASPCAGRIKELSEIHGESPALSSAMLKLLRWMSDYYLAPEGIVLKQTIPGEVFTRTKAKRTTKDGTGNALLDFVEIPEADLASVRGSLFRNEYRAFLLHAPSLAYEYSLAPAMITAPARNVLIIVPEIFHADMLYRSVRDMFDERVCVLHGRTAKGKRSEYMEGIISGRYDIVIGTRPALFAPMKSVSLIMVLNEHNGSYKLEEGIRYNMRDVAVMRGLLEKSTVLLSSITPSVDSYYNALSGKYDLIKPEPGKRPRITIVRMGFEKKPKSSVSKAVIEASKNRIRDGKRIMFVINRRGYSTLLLCRECGQSALCPVCGIPFVLHKGDRALKCHYCGASQDVIEQCDRCRSYSLELVGTGTQKVQEDIEALFKVESLRFDSDSVRKGIDMERMLKEISGDSRKIIIGTKLMTKRMAPHNAFSMASVLNIDTSLSVPDFRASEKAYTELSSIISLVEPGGEVLIQTRFPEIPLFRHLKSGDYTSFVKEELRLRKVLLYPPYSKLLKIIVSGNTGLSDRIARQLRSMNQDMEILGPTTAINKKGVEESSIMLKSGSRKILNKAARVVLEKFGNIKGTRITVDVDPL